MSVSPLRIIPLGGLGEIGRNMMAVEYGGEIVVIDAGVLFPEEGMPGVDFAISNIAYLVENRDAVKAILITHGHEDHIGALPYVLTELNVPVYASRLTHGLISLKLREHGQLKQARLNVVEPNHPFKVGHLKIEFFRVCHSIPDAMGISIETPLGSIIHTGDFKIDHTPADGKTTDFPFLARLGTKGVILLCSDSTYAEVDGYTPSEQVVGEALDIAIGSAEGRVMVATFASLISRIQQVIDAAAKHGRTVSVVGRSMLNNVKMSTRLGYLKDPGGVIVPLRKARDFPNERVVILATGAQGEPTSALVRIANKEHQDIEVIPGDTVVISASPIPGNETLVAKTIDNLYRQQARVLYSRIALVHVHGHGSREELKMMLSLVKPRFFVPVHGEYRHLVAHASIAQSTGIPKSNTFVLEDGDVLELTKDHGEIVDQVPAGPVFVDGKKLWHSYEDVLAERRRLAKDGIVIISMTVNSTTLNLQCAPEMTSSGFVEIEESTELLQKTSQEARTTLEQYLKNDLDWESAKSTVVKSISKFLYSQTGMRPKVIVQIHTI